jgi:hypothetical protein
MSDGASETPNVANSGEEVSNTPNEATANSPENSPEAAANAEENSANAGENSANAGENTAAPTENTAAPNATENTAAPNATENSPEVAANGEQELANQMNQGDNTVVPNMTASEGKTKKPLSAAAKKVLDDRMKTYNELKEAYTATFGNAPRAPKAKSYEAFALHKIRTEQGENAYKAKMKEYIERNQGKFASMPEKKTRKKVQLPEELPANNVTQKNSRQTLINSIKSMGQSAKELIDTMMSTTMTLAKNNSGDMTALAVKANEVANNHKPRKTRSNKGHKHKSRKARD